MISAALFAGALLAEGALFAALLLWLAHVADLRERDLLNRIMARDYADYATHQPQPEKAAAPPERRHNALVRQAERRVEEARLQAARAAKHRQNPLLGDDDR